MRNEKIFITGGAGYLGTELIRRLYKDNSITIFSRNISNHQKLKTEFPDVVCIEGDIRNYEAINKAMVGHTVAIFAGSVKRIDEVDKNPLESSHIIIDGAINSRNAAIYNKLKVAVFISSDKSRNSTTLYGAMKFIAGESFIINAEGEETKLNSIICGNIVNSTGSVIPLIWNAIHNKTALTLYGEHMTRFMMDPDEVLTCITEGYEKTGYNIIPNLKSHKVKDLFDLYAEKFGLIWKIGQPRIAEKVHEQMISLYEIPRTLYEDQKNIYFTHYKDISPVILDAKTTRISSEQNLITKDELRTYLQKYNYFMPI